MKSPLENRILQKLYDLIDLGVAPGFQLSLGFREECLGVYAAGFRDPVSRRPLYETTFMDVSSLTKILVSSRLLMLALQKKLISDLDVPLKNFFPFLVSELKNRTLVELLTHRAGLQAVFEETEEIEGGREEKKRFFLRRLDESYSADSVGQELYSDVGFMLLGMVIEVLFGNHLRKVFESEFPPETGLVFGPLDFKWDRWSWLFSVPTYARGLSLSEPPIWLHGRVQDPRAAWLEGVAGHAGLFANVAGIETWAKELYLSYHGKGRRLSDKTVRNFIDFEKKSGRFLGGFDTPSSTTESISQAGYHASATTVGHLGFTGCSFWMDIEKGYRICLLSHRHQEGGRPEKLKNFRPGFHDWLYEEVFFRLEV